MHFTISKTKLLKELAALIGIIERKSTIPILGNLLLEATVDGLTLKGTDLDVSLSTRADAEVKQPGALCVPAKKLNDIVRNLPDAEIEVKLDGEQMQMLLKCERSKFKLLGLPTENFPEIPATEGEFLNVPAAMLRALIARTEFAITKEESRFALNGAKVEIKGGRARMVATDGHRLSLAEAALEQTAEIDVLIPKKTLIEVSKLAADAEQVEMALSVNHVFFRAGARLLSSRLLTGQFPNYDLVLPKKNNNRITVAVSDLSAAVRRVALMADERSRAIKIDLKDGRLSLSAVSTDAGEADESLSADYNGPLITICLNAEYLLDVLGLDLGEKIVIAFKDKDLPILLTPAESGEVEFKGVIMPMRLA